MTKPITNTLTNLGKGERYLRYTCGSGVGITRTASALDYPQAVSRLAESLDSAPGVLLASSYEYPGRYRRWDIGFVNPLCYLKHAADNSRCGRSIGVATFF